MTKDTMPLAKARKVAIQTAADWVAHADWDQFWGEDLAVAAWNDEKLATILTRAKREAAERIRRIRHV